MSEGGLVPEASGSLIACDAVSNLHGCRNPQGELMVTSTKNSSSLQSSCSPSVGITPSSLSCFPGNSGSPPVVLDLPTASSPNPSPTSLIPKPSPTIAPSPSAIMYDKLLGEVLYVFSGPTRETDGLGTFCIELGSRCNMLDKEIGGSRHDFTDDGVFTKTRCDLNFGRYMSGAYSPPCGTFSMVLLSEDGTG